MGEDSDSSRQDEGVSKLNCFIQIDEVNFWLSRTRDLIATAETHRNRVFQGSIRELRRELRKAEFALVVALNHFQLEMEERAIDTKNQ